MKWMEELSAEQRKCLVFLLCYERVRRGAQAGYKAAPELNAGIIERPIFKQCRAVVAWLEVEGWEISWLEVHWQGYLKHVFQRMRPTIPMPAQLKNPILLRSYLQSVPTETRVYTRTPKDLESVYKKVLRSEVRDHGGLRSALGIPEK